MKKLTSIFLGSLFAGSIAPVISCSENFIKEDVPKNPFLGSLNSLFVTDDHKELSTFAGVNLTPQQSSLYANLVSAIDLLPPNGEFDKAIDLSLFDEMREVEKDNPQVEIKINQSKHLLIKYITNKFEFNTFDTRYLNSIDKLLGSEFASEFKKVRDFVIEARLTAVEILDIDKFGYNIADFKNGKKMTKSQIEAEGFLKQAVWFMNTDVDYDPNSPVLIPLLSPFLSGLGLSGSQIKSINPQLKEDNLISDIINIVGALVKKDQLQLIKTITKVLKGVDMSFIPEYLTDINEVNEVFSNGLLSFALGLMGALPDRNGVRVRDNIISNIEEIVALLVTGLFESGVFKNGESFETDDFFSLISLILTDYNLASSGAINATRFPVMYRKLKAIISLVYPNLGAWSLYDTFLSIAKNPIFDAINKATSSFININSLFSLIQNPSADRTDIENLKVFNLLMDFAQAKFKAINIEQDALERITNELKDILNLAKGLAGDTAGSELSEYSEYVRTKVGSGTTYTISKSIAPAKINTLINALKDVGVGTLNDAKINKVFTSLKDVDVVPANAVSTRPKNFADAVNYDYKRIANNFDESEIRGFIDTTIDIPWEWKHAHGWNHNHTNSWRINLKFID